MFPKKILNKLKQCKDIEFVVLVHFLEETIPAIFFQYGTHFPQWKTQLLFTVYGTYCYIIHLLETAVNGVSVCKDGLVLCKW